MTTNRVTVPDIFDMLHELAAQTRHLREHHTTPDGAIVVDQIHRPAQQTAAVVVTMTVLNPTPAEHLIAVALEVADESGQLGYMLTTDEARIDPADPTPLAGTVAVTIYRD